MPDPAPRLSPPHGVPPDAVIADAFRQGAKDGAKHGARQGASDAVRGVLGGMFKRPRP